MDEDKNQRKQFKFPIFLVPRNIWESDIFLVIEKDAWAQVDAEIQRFKQTQTLTLPIY